MGMEAACTRTFIRIDHDRNGVFGRRPGRRGRVGLASCGKAGSWRDPGTGGVLGGGAQGGKHPQPRRSSPGEAAQIREMREVLSRELARESRSQDDEAWKALSRIAQYLRHRVESPLLEGLDGGVEGLRRAADEALGAVEDLEFFLEDPPSSGAGNQEPGPGGSGGDPGVRRAVNGSREGPNPTGAHPGPGGGRALERCGLPGSS